jgi:branched-chain amino acid transport system ATP-binding protein
VNGSEPPATPPADPILVLRGVRAGYAGIEAVSGVDLTVPTGGIFAILGPNGAGKSTLLAVASRLHPLVEGDVEYAGANVNRASADKLARRGVCLIPEGRSVFPSLTVKENLRLVTHIGVSFGDIEERVYTAFPRLAERRKQLAGTLSGGEQQMLALARATATEPRLLMIDELSMGLAPLIVLQLYELVAQLAESGITVVVVEQFAHTILDVAKDAVIMSSGRIAHQGSPKELEARLADAYLGASTPAGG